MHDPLWDPLWDLCFCSDSCVLSDFAQSILFDFAPSVLVAQSLCEIDVTWPHVTCDTHEGLLACVLACPSSHSRNEVTVATC